MKYDIKKYLINNVFRPFDKIYLNTHNGNLVYDVIFDAVGRECHEIVNKNNNELLGFGYCIFLANAFALYVPEHKEEFVENYGELTLRKYDLSSIVQIVRVYPIVVDDLALFPDYYLGGMNRMLTNCLKQIMAIKRFGYAAIGKDKIVGIFHDKIGRDETSEVRKILALCIERVYKIKSRDIVFKGMGGYDQFYFGEHW